MRLSSRFLDIVQKQLNSFEGDAAIKYLVLYVAQASDVGSPKLEAIGFWPIKDKSLPPIESDPELRAPSLNRRWYPLQEGSILLGVLRAERFPSEEVWPDALDNRLRSIASLISQCLGLEIDRSKIQNQLNEQSEQISLLIHQLRNPLAALRTYAKLLLKKLGPQSNYIELIEGLLTEQDQLNKYISAINDLGSSKFKLPLSNEGQGPLLLPPVLPENTYLNIRSVLEPLIERASATASLQGRKWYGPINWPSWTNLKRSNEQVILAEVVANLLENAFNYSDPPVPVGLSLCEIGLCVWDGGKLILKADRDKIFEKGYRGKNSKYKLGSGLGLSLARGLIDELGGCIKFTIAPKEFNSELPKSGNAFIIKLPVKMLQL